MQIGHYLSFLVVPLAIKSYLTFLFLFYCSFILALLASFHIYPSELAFARLLCLFVSLIFLINQLSFWYFQIH